VAVRYVPLAEIEAERAELESLQAGLTEAREELHRFEIERYDPVWRENVRLSRTIRYHEMRLAEERRRLEELRRRGWARLRAEERSEYLRLRDSTIPRRETMIRELRESQEKVIRELWILTEERARLTAEISRLEGEVRAAQRRIARKVVAELRRVELNFYIIVEMKTKYFRRLTAETVRKHGRLVQRKYPKGKFQVLYQIDSFYIAETDTVLTEIDPASTIIRRLREDAARQVEEYFHVYFIPPQFTVGVTNVLLDMEELGRPPKKVQIARTVEPPVEAGMSPKEDWKKNMEEYIMTQAEYNALTAPMTDYVAELKRLGKYQEAL